MNNTQKSNLGPSATTNFQPHLSSGVSQNMNAFMVQHELNSDNG